MCSYSRKTIFLNFDPRFRFAISISTACSFVVHNLKKSITVPLFKFNFIRHTNQTTENNKMLFVNKWIYKFILQVIRNFKVEYDYEMKFKNTLLRTPASPLKFRMTDREGWRSSINLSALTVTEFEHIMWFDRFACNTQIKSSDFNNDKFSWN
jgi:hypothetical protein